MTHKKPAPGPLSPVADPRFPLGKIIVRPRARARLETTCIQEALRRHASGDWGVVDSDHRKANRLSLRRGWSLHSVYGAGELAFWIITEADRSLTTVMMPDEGYPCWRSSAERPQA